MHQALNTDCRFSICDKYYSRNKNAREKAFSSKLTNQIHYIPFETSPTVNSKTDGADTILNIVERSLKKFYKILIESFSNDQKSYRICK